MRSKIIPIIIVLLAATACNLRGGSMAQSSPQPAMFSTATPSMEGGIPVSATPIRLVIPSGLATGATADTIDVVTEQTGAPWDVAPAHLQLTLQGYSVEVSSHVAQIFVYPAQDYASLNPAAAESLKRLQSVIANPSGAYGNDSLPRIPFYNAGQVLAAQQKPIQFSSGTGIRFVTQYGQDVSPINNGGLFYSFHGLTADGKYYIIAVLPVNLPFLAADNNPNSPISSAGIPFPPAPASGATYQDYYNQVTKKIDATPANQFSPSLDVLDALVESIAVQ